MAAPHDVGAQALRQRSAIERNSRVGLRHCLVASARATTREWLVSAGQRWGWDVVVCNSPEEAAKALVLGSPQLAFVDLEGPEGQAFCDLAEKIARECKSLLVVCGNEQDAAEESWSRQLGAWFYLPGMRPSAGLHLLFRDATSIVDKRIVDGNSGRQAAVDAGSWPGQDLGPS